MKILEQEGTKIGIKNCGQCCYSNFSLHTNEWICCKKDDDVVEGTLIIGNHIDRMYIDGNGYEFPVFCKLKDATLLCD